MGGVDGKLGSWRELGDWGVQGAHRSPSRGRLHQVERELNRLAMATDLGEPHMEYVRHTRGWNTRFVGTGPVAVDSGLVSMELGH